MMHDSQCVVSGCFSQTGMVGISMAHDSQCVVSGRYNQTGFVGISIERLQLPAN